MGKLFIVQVEGIDKSGKSTVAHWLVYELNRFLPEFGWRAVVEHEPVKPIPEEIRGFFLHPKTKYERRILYKQLDWFIKDRQEHIARLKRKYKDKNIVVVMDRYMVSTLVYQVISLNTTRALFKFWWGHRKLPKPNYNLYVLPPENVYDFLKFKEVYKGLRHRNLDPDPEDLLELVKRYYHPGWYLYDMSSSLLHFFDVDWSVYRPHHIFHPPVDREEVREVAYHILNKVVFD